MFHLESGACARSGSNYDDIMRYADDFFMLDQCDRYEHDWKYKCSTCQIGFRNIGALFQHVESLSCAQDYSGEIGKLRAYIVCSVLGEMPNRLDRAAFDNILSHLSTLPC